MHHRIVATIISPLSLRLRLLSSRTPARSPRLSCPKKPDVEDVASGAAFVRPEVLITAYQQKVLPFSAAQAHDTIRIYNRTCMRHAPSVTRGVAVCEQLLIPPSALALLAIVITRSSRNASAPRALARHMLATSSLLGSFLANCYLYDMLRRAKLNDSATRELEACEKRLSLGVEAGHAWSTLQSARAHERAGKLGRAAELFKRAAELGCEEAWAPLGSLEQQRNNVELAKQIWDRGIKVETRQGDCSWLLGSKSDGTKRRGLWLRAAAMGHVDAMRALAGLCRTQGDFSWALEWDHVARQYRPIGEKL